MARAAHGAGWRWLLAGATLLGTACVQLDALHPPGVDPNAPAPFALTSPAQGEVAVPRYPVFRWSPSMRHQSYRFELADDGTFANVLQTTLVDPSKTFLDFATELTNGETYFWRMSAVGEDAETLASGSGREFRVGWLSGFASRSPITLDHPGPALVDIAIPLDPTGIADSDSPGPVEQTRFTTDDGVTEVSFFAEQKFDGAVRRVWVRIPDVPVGTSTIYHYFEDEKAALGDSGLATFPFFDDFDDTTVDASRWAALSTGGGSQESSGLLTLAGFGNVTVDYQAVVGQVAFNSTDRLLAVANVQRPAGGDVNGRRHGLMWRSEQSGDYSLTAFAYMTVNGDGDVSAEEQNGLGAATALPNMAVIPSPGSAVFSVIRDPTSQQIHVQYNEDAPETLTPTWDVSTAQYIALQSDNTPLGSTDFAGDFDWIFVTPFPAALPSATVGPPESGNFP